MPESIVAVIAALLAAGLHTMFWYLESITFRREATWRRFGIRSQADADVIRPMAFNQGFYNLFLAVGVVVGVVLITTGSVEAGRAVVVFGCACLVAAGVVLLLRDGSLARSALIQLVPPLIAIIATLAL
jgi:putative membrane protein